VLWRKDRIFATGTTTYLFLPVENPKLNLEVEIEGIRSLAVVDTAAPYLVCSLELGTQLKLSSSSKLGLKEIRTHRGLIRGSLHRLVVRLIATQGCGAEIEANLGT
jgi:hypothetical protein